MAEGDCIVSNSTFFLAKSLDTQTYITICVLKSHLWFPKLFSIIVWEAIQHGV